jgi:2-keto-3-deoxy-L-rhamnonate aldolase RhmA
MTGRKTVRALMATKAVKVGHFVTEFMTPGIGHVLRAAGCDYVAFDMEHTGYEYDTVRRALRYAEAAGLATMVRPPSKQYHDISRAFDIGCDAILGQIVGTAEEAERLVEFMKYRPRGNRGVTIEYYHDAFASGPLAPKLKAANRAAVLIALIESEQGVNNVDAIAAVDGVDGLEIGHVDLSVDLGIPGQYDHPRLHDALRAIAAAARKHGKSFAWGYGSVGTLEDARRMGADFILYGSDTGTLRAAVGAGVAEIRDRCAAVSRRAASPARTR